MQSLSEDLAAAEQAAVEYAGGDPDAAEEDVAARQRVRALLGGLHELDAMQQKMLMALEGSGVE